MQSTFRSHLTSNRISQTTDWVVLIGGALLLTTAIIGTLVTPALSIQNHVELKDAETKAAL